MDWGVDKNLRRWGNSWPQQHIVCFRHNFQIMSSTVFIFLTREITELKLHRTVILPSTCRMHTEWDGFFSRHSCLPSHLFLPVDTFFAAFYLVQTWKSAKVLHGTWAASHIRMTFVYAFCLLKKRLGKMQGNTGSNLWYLTQQKWFLSLITYIWFFIYFAQLLLYRSS